MPRTPKTIKQPENVRSITKKFIGDYFKEGLEKKTISQAEFEEWIETVRKIEEETSEEEKMKVFGKVRTAFIDKYYPNLSKNKKASLVDYFKAVQDKK